MTQSAPLQPAFPFWLSLGLLPLVWASAVFGGWAVLLVPLGSWVLFSALDAMRGHHSLNPDPQTEETALELHRLVTLVWAPLQFVTIFGTIAWVANSDHLSVVEALVVAFGIGIVTGTIGITYAHELMHQSNRTERWMADILMAMALYGHFRSEHLLVHHRYVGTPRDPVTARYNESFFAFFPRVLIQCWRSAWKAETNQLARKGLPRTDPSNPFWRYSALQLGFLILAMLVGGWWGLVLFLVQALTAVWHLEMVNYIEHYGLTRKHLGGGKYEHTQPHHSWNTDLEASNWLLINLQRHSDHHYKPDRRFPLLQTYAASEAPQLPYGYSVMGFFAMIPPLWRRRMNPLVRNWRKTFYPEITDWRLYTSAGNPPPR